MVAFFFFLSHGIIESSIYVRGGERPVTDDDEKRLLGEQRFPASGEYSNGRVFKFKRSGYQLIALPHAFV